MDAAEQTLLDGLAVSPHGLTQTMLIALVNNAGHRPDDGRKAGGPWIIRTTEALPEVQRNGRYEHADRREHVRRLHAQGRLLEVLDAVQAVEPYEPPRSRWDFGSPTHVQRRALIHALVSQDDQATQRLLDTHQDSVIGVWEWFLDPIEPALLADLTPFGLSLCVDSALEYALARLDPAPSAIEQVLADRDVVGDLVLAAAAARAAWLRGDLPRARALAAPLTDPEDEYLRGALALLDGDVKGSCKHYATAIAADRKIHGNDFVPRHAEGFLLPLAYLLSGTKSRQKQALTLITRAWQVGWTRPGYLHEGWIALRALADTHAPIPDAHHAAALLMVGLVRRWRGEDLASQPRLLAAQQRLSVRGFELFAAELDPTTPGPLGRLRTVRPAWKDALDALGEVLGVQAESAPQAGPDARLAWTLHDGGRTLHLEAREQKRRKKGWSAGRRVALERIYGASDVSLPWTPADKAVAKGLGQHRRRSYGGYTEIEHTWDREVTWRALVDHPAVFDPEGEPLRIVRRSPVLRIEDVDGGRRVALDPPLKPREVRAERVGQAYEVTHLDSRQVRAAEVIGAGLSVPAEGVEVLKALLARSGDLFVQGAESAEVRDADPRVHLFLAPSGTSIHVEVGVLPAGADGPRRAPGAGSAVVLGSVDGNAARFRRDLGLERTYLDAVLAWSTLHDMDAAKGTVLELDEALDLLAAAREQEVPILWPEGGEIRVRRPVSGVQVKVSAARDWFEARGALDLDDGASVPLVELAQALLQAGSRRFIALKDGTYVDLEERLRRSLDLVARVGSPLGESIRLHPLASSALASLMDQDGVSATRPVQQRIAQAMAPPSEQPVPRGLRAELRPYQADAYRWLCGLAALGGGAILADDMGLGKTIVALAVLLRQAAEGPSLVIAPTSVAGNWMREAVRFAPGLTLHRLRELDAGAVEALGPGDVLVCSYSLLVHRIDVISTRSYQAAVFDESQALKNPATQRHQAALRVQAGFRLALTGTPIENHLGELHAQLSVVLPGLLPGKSAFAERFTRPIESDDASARRSLQALVRPFLLRRTKEAVLDDLPARMDTDLLVELSPEEAALYEAQRQQAVAALDEGSTAIDVLGQLVRLRQLACSPALVVEGYDRDSAKTRAFRRLCRDLHESGHRALVFSQFVKHLALLRRVLDEEGLTYAYLDGSTPAKARDQRVREFQTGDLGFFLISLKAGGVGLNLTAADYVVHMDPWWNPAVEDQASDRAHRIGQRRPVTVYRVIAKGTVEEQIIELHRTKRALADQILEGSETVQRLSASDLLALLRDGEGGDGR